MVQPNACPLWGGLSCSAKLGQWPKRGILFIYSLEVGRCMMQLAFPRRRIEVQNDDLGNSSVPTMLSTICISTSIIHRKLHLNPKTLTLAWFGAEIWLISIVTVVQIVSCSIWSQVLILSTWGMHWELEMFIEKYVTNLVCVITNKIGTN
jgi:hypothetical protein